MKHILRCILAAVLSILCTAVPAKAMTVDEYMEELSARKDAEAVQAMSEVWVIESGCLTEHASEELLAAAVDLAEALPEESEHRENLAVIAEAAAAELNKPKMHLYGVCTITHYCNCVQCCHEWAGCNTASGVPPTPWHTVAHNFLPFGTKVMIDGAIYTVEDRGDANMSNGDWFDIYVSDHRTASGQGMHQSEVYIIDEESETDE